MSTTYGSPEAFYRTHDRNQFDKLVVDVPELYRRCPPSTAATWGGARAARRSPLSAVYQSPILPLRLRQRLRRVARQTGLDLCWFHEFEEYWSLVLGGRKLWGVDDLAFLKNLYRIRFHAMEVPDSQDPFVHVEAFQRPELIYQLLHLVYRESVRDELTAWSLLLRHKSNVRSMLEYGCATAPVTASLFEFYGPRKVKQVYLADISTIAFHYACHRFRNYPHVRPIPILPEHDCVMKFDGQVDVIFCVAVLEHLNEPLATIKALHAALARGGVLLFDYILSEGEGMDTMQAVRERASVLRFIRERFDVLVGDLPDEASIGLTVARRR